LPGQFTVLLYAAGGPVVHLAHGHPDRSAASLALRIGLPLLGRWALTPPNCSIDLRRDEKYQECMSGRRVVGNFFTALGVLAAVVVDAAALARDTVPAPEPSSVSTRFWITPMLARDHEPAGLNLGGTF
jgi:hypothetical protein